MILIRLGLRAGEVAGLRLDDIDWRADEIVVRGRGRHEERLPLPSDVGEGRPLVSFPTIIESISATTTSPGLSIQAEQDWNNYETGRNITDAELDAVPLARHTFHSLDLR